MTPVYVLTEAFDYERGASLTLAGASLRRWAVFFSLFISAGLFGLPLWLVTQPSGLLSSSMIVGCFVGISLPSVWILCDKVHKYVAEEDYSREWRDRRARALRQHFVFFNNDDRGWYRLKDPFFELPKWFQKNQMDAVIARYDDPLFGTRGLYISFNSDEDMILFKMTFCDQF